MKKLLAFVVLLMLLVSCADSTVIENNQINSSTSTQQSEQSFGGAVEGGEYVANIVTKKYHTQFCSDVAKMNEENMHLTYDVAELVDKGYSPCEKCISRTAS